MPTTTTPSAARFSADRAAWVAAGRPADEAFPHWARVMDQARTSPPAGPAIGVRVGDGYATIELADVR